MTKATFVDLFHIISSRLKGSRGCGLYVRLCDRRRELFADTNEVLWLDNCDIVLTELLVQERGNSWERVDFDSEEGRGEARAIGVDEKGLTLS